jgi:hypothetical protein
MSKDTNNFAVAGGPSVSVKKVDQAKVELGKRTPLVDTRPDPVKATMDQIANPPCPREQMRGQRNSKNYNENGKAFRSSGFTNTDSDAGN